MPRGTVVFSQSAPFYRIGRTGVHYGVSLRTLLKKEKHPQQGVFYMVGRSRPM